MAIQDYTTNSRPVVYFRQPSFLEFIYYGRLSLTEAKMHNKAHKVKTILTMLALGCLPTASLAHPVELSAPLAAVITAKPKTPASQLKKAIKSVVESR